MSRSFVSLSWFSEEHGNSVGISIMECIIFDAQGLQPAVHLVFRVLPRIVRVVPIEIDHVVCFEVERIVPKALDEIVVDQSLDVMCAGGDPEHFNWLFEGDTSADSAQFTSHFGQGTTCIETFLR